MISSWKKIGLIGAFVLVLVIAGPGSLAAAVPEEHPELEEDAVYIQIDKRRNLLSVVLNGSTVYRFRVATGRLGKPTPTGKFKIVTKVVKPYYLPKKIAGGHKDNPLGTRWMGLSIGNGYKYGIHGTHRPYSIGHSVSSGCVRMSNRDIEFLFRHIPLRTTVIITGDP